MAYLKLFKNNNWPINITLGDTLGVFAPSAPFNLKHFEEGISILEKIGFNLKFGKNIYKKNNYLAGTEQEKLEDFNSLIFDDKVKALIAARGGYGAMRLLEFINWNSLPKKAIIGFSDITALHLARLKKSGLISYHAPVITSLNNLNNESLENFKNFLLKPETFTWQFNKENILKTGKAEGYLLGGNLSLFNCLLASEYLPEYDSIILLIEDIAEEPYKLDRLFMVLKQSYIWEKISALVFGAFTDCGSEEFIKNLILDLSKNFLGPVIYNAPFGHAKLNMAWPMGAKAFLQCGY